MKCLSGIVHTRVDRVLWRVDNLSGEKTENKSVNLIEFKQVTTLKLSLDCVEVIRN